VLSLREEIDVLTNRISRIRTSVYFLVDTLGFNSKLKDPVKLNKLCGSVSSFETALARLQADAADTRAMISDRRTVISGCVHALSRSKNVIILGSKKSVSEHVSVRHAYDREVVDGVLSILSSTKPTITRWHRLGN